MDKKRIYSSFKFKVSLRVLSVRTKDGGVGGPGDVFFP